MFARKLSSPVNDVRRVRENGDLVILGLSDVEFARWLADYSDTVLRLGCTPLHATD